MESIEFKKFTRQLQNLLLKLLHDLEDPALQRLTINHLKVNRNRTFATVYLDLVSNRNPKIALQKLNRLNAFFNSKLSNYISKYRIPRFKFVEDKVFDRGQRIESLIKDSIKKDA